MGGSVGKSESDSDSNSAFMQKVWGGQKPALSNLYGDVNRLFDRTASRSQRLEPSAIRYMNNIAGGAVPAWMQQLGGGAYQNMGLQNNLMQSLRQSLNMPTNTQQIYASVMGGDGNTYADALRDQYLEDAQYAHRNMLNNMDARAVNVGQSGSSRHGVAQALGAEDINRNLLQNMARVGYDSFDKDLDNKLRIAGQADQNTLARQQMMQNMLGNMNQSQQFGLGASPEIQQMGMARFQPMMVPWDAMSHYANAIGRPTILGSGNAAGSSDSKGFSLAGGMFS